MQINYSHQTFTSKTFLSMYEECFVCAESLRAGMLKQQIHAICDGSDLKAQASVFHS